jgi:hypothetical protein
LRKVSRLIAFQVARTARDEGLGRSLTDEALWQEIEGFCWFPEYPEQDHPIEHEPVRSHNSSTSVQMQLTAGRPAGSISESI